MNNAKVHIRESLANPEKYNVFVWVGIVHKMFTISSCETDVYLGEIDGKHYTLNLNHGENEVYTHDEYGRYMPLTREEQNSVLRQIILEGGDV